MRLTKEICMKLPDLGVNRYSRYKNVKFYWIQSCKNVHTQILSIIKMSVIGKLWGNY